jgi:AraC-like DNA-binding protein
VDALASILLSPRARNAFVLRCVMDPPWSLRIQDRSPLSVAAMVRGHAWVVNEDGTRNQLNEGSVAIMRGPEPYVVADDPTTPPQVVIHPGQRCTAPDGRNLHEAMDLGIRTWGNRRNGAMMMVVGVYQMPGEISRRLLSVLPAVLSVPADGSPLIPLLAEEAGRDNPGQEAVLDRLLDLLLISTLRAWFARSDGGGPAWRRAAGDSVVGRALRMLHDDPAHPWTVAELAAATGVSRAALARRFTERVGEPPMTYLTSWRLALAADLLREPDATVAAVARRVGYASAFTFSSAFKRVRGVSPREYRAVQATGSPGSEPVVGLST